MGKILIIKGADFSANAIDSIYFNLLVVNGTINGSSGNYGNWNFSTPDFDGIRLKSDKTRGIQLSAGQSVTLIGVAGLGIGYFVYSANEALTGNCLKDECVSSPILNTSGDNSFTYTNETSQTVYIWFLFKWNGTDGIHQNNEAISPSDVEIKYE